MSQKAQAAFKPDPKRKAPPGYFYVEQLDPEIVRSIMDANPRVRSILGSHWAEEGLKEGLEKGLAPLEHQFSRRLKRRLTRKEKETLRLRLDKLGPDRLGDVVLDLDPAKLKAWLANPRAR
jgi:hypothetical protein